MGQYVSQDPLGPAGGIRTHGYVHNPLTWVDPLGLAACPYGGYFQRKDLRSDIYNAQRPGGYHATKHIRARTAEEAQALSLGKGARAGRLEASYLPDVARNIKALEKQAAYDAVRNGHVFEHGGTYYMFARANGPVGYNNGSLTNWMRIEITRSGSPVIHSFPASIDQVSKYIPHAN